MSIDENVKNESSLPFEQVVAESRAIIQESEIVAPKRGRGRPRKFETSQPKAETEVSQSSGAPQTPTQFDVSETLVVPLQLLTSGPSREHNIPELALSDDEARAIAKALNDVFNAFVPDLAQMSPKTAAVLGASLVIGSITVTKYQIYLDHKKKNQKFSEPVTEVQEEIAKEQEESPLFAGEYFSRQHAKA